MNHFTLLGRLTRDPELKNVGTNNVATVSVAYTEKFKVGNETKEWTSYLDAKIWGKTAINFAEYHSKGSLVLLEGSLKQERWEGNDGAKHSKVILNVSRWHFVGGKKSDSPQPATSF